MEYAMGIATLAQSLRDVGSGSLPLIVIVPANGAFYGAHANEDCCTQSATEGGADAPVVLTAEVSALLRASNARVICVPRYIVEGFSVEEQAGLPRLGTEVWAKLWLWTFTEWDTIIYADADTLFLQPLSRILRHPSLSPRSMLAGDLVAFGEYSQGSVLVIRPSLATFAALRTLLQPTRPGPLLSFPHAEQDGLNLFFASAKHRLPAEWLCASTLSTRCVAVDFAGGTKPWQRGSGGEKEEGGGRSAAHALWQHTWARARARA
tara:strand:+ start:113 stop:904 length:792 start_codon:yes stop_codon:yes gene_type:complete